MTFISNRKFDPNITPIQWAQVITVLCLWGSFLGYLLFSHSPFLTVLLGAGAYFSSKADV